MESEVTVKILYDWDRITQDDLIRVLVALPGVSEVQTSSLSERVASSVRWRVQDNVTGASASMPYDQRDTANYICRGLNTPEAGGRYGVYINDGQGWRRDLE